MTSGRLCSTGTSTALRGMPASSVGASRNAPPVGEAQPILFWSAVSLPW
jgi:hypothetical protein